MVGDLACQGDPSIEALSIHIVIDDFYFIFYFNANMYTDHIASQFITLNVECIPKLLNFRQIPLAIFQC